MDARRAPALSAPASSPHGNWIAWLVGAALLCAVVIAAMQFTEERAFVRLVQKTHPLWLIVAAVLQACTYLAEAEVWRGVTRAAGTSISTGTLYRLGVAKLFVDQSIPSGGLSGTLLFVQGLRRVGTSRGAAMAGVVVATCSYYFSYMICLCTALVVAFAHDALSAPVAVTAGSFLVISAALSAVVLRQAGRSHGNGLVDKIPIAGRALRLLRSADPKLAHDFRILRRAVLAQLVIVALDAATLWVCLLAVGESSQPLPVFSGYMFSSLFRTLSVVPGGLGAFEAASTYMLHTTGTPVEAALSATLLFRGLSFWLPMVPGLLFARQATGRRRRAHF